MRGLNFQRALKNRETLKKYLLKSLIFLFAAFSWRSQKTMAVRTSPRCSHPVRDACRDTSTTNDKGSKLNVLKDQEFSKSRQVLLAKKKQLVEESAKGNRPRAARELFEEEEDLLFTSGEFGDGSPEALQRTVWWLLSMQFGFRARDESRKLKWGDINLITDGTTGNEVLVWIGERG